MKKKSLLFPLVFLLSLTSCSSKVDNIFSKYQNESFKKIETKFDVDTDTYYQHSSYDKINYYNNFDVNISTQYENIIPHKSHMNTVGVAKLLVIPVSLVDSNRDIENMNNKRIAIQNAFFGDKSHNSYYSVSEYYRRSSYGALSFEGYVTDWYQYNEIIPYGTSGQTISETILKKALEDIALKEDKYFFKGTNKEDTSYNSLSSFTKENTNDIDGIFMIYDHPYSTTSGNEDVYWAFTHSVEPSPQTIIPTTTLRYGYYSWASFDFTHFNNNKVDSKTYIHETGHLLGLEDYYNRDGLYQPTGGLDMMDTNLGDHSSYSKMFLNWVTPKVIKNSGTFSLSSFSNSGDVLLIPLTSKYNNTPIDEYLLVEYFTPFNLNNHHGEKYGITDKYGRTHQFSYPDTYGLKIYHVDSTLSYFNGLRGQTYARDITEMGAVSLPCVINYKNKNNGLTDSINSKALINLLEPNGATTFRNGVPGGNSTLFGVSETFSSAQYRLIPNKNITIKLEKISNNNCTISVAL